MRGESTLILNQRTVVEAVQAYLDKHFTPPMKLTALVPSLPSGQSYGTPDTPTYTATICEIESASNDAKAFMPLTQNKPGQAGDVTPTMIEAGVATASQWLEENRGSIEEGGDGDLHSLVKLLFQLRNC